MSDILNQLKKRTAQELEKRVNSALPTSMQLKFAPGEEEEGEEEGEEEEEEGEEEEGEEEGEEEEGEDEIGSLAFEDASKDENLACAAAAYRIFGTEDIIVATHPTGAAFCGTEEDLVDYSEGKDLDIDGWEIYDQPADILDLEYDTDTLKKVIQMMEAQEQSYEGAEDFYEKFHWGNPSNVQVVKHIPGVQGTLVHLGVARRIEYGANKNGDWAEYYHLFGENTKQYPSVYALMNEGETEPTCLVIHGGNMTVQPRGIVE